MLEINTLSATPIYEQIVEQVRKSVATGALAPGTPLPPIRQLARDLELNPATVAKAYQLLEKDGVLETAGRRGTFVSGDALSRLHESLRHEAVAELRELLARFRARGLSAPDLRELVDDLFARSYPEETTP
jgi:GntR family transcriptional regulator